MIKAAITGQKGDARETINLLAIAVAVQGKGATAPQGIVLPPVIRKRIVEAIVALDVQGLDPLLVVTDANAAESTAIPRESLTAAKHPRNSPAS